MVTNEAEVKAAAQHIWPHAKRIALSARISDATNCSVMGFDAQDRLIDQVTAESLLALKKKLDSMIPEGGKRRKLGSGLRRREIGCAPVDDAILSRSTMAIAGRSCVYCR